MATQPEPWTFDESTGVLMYEGQPVTTLTPVPPGELGRRITTLLNLDEDIERAIRGNRHGNTGGETR